MWTYNHTPVPDELYHHGIKGMQWGKRRYQNPDGSLTPEGKKRYEAASEKRRFKEDVKDFKKGKFRANVDVDTKTGKIYNAKYYNARGEEVTQEYVDKIVSAKRNQKIITRSLVGLAVVGVGAAAVNKMLNDATYEINGTSVNRKEFFGAVKSALGK